MIKIDSLNKSYDKKPALKDANLTLGSGRFICLVGPNGSGKSTLIKLILGLILPSTGNIQIQRGVRFGYMPEMADIPKYFTGNDLLKIMSKGLAGKVEMATDLAEKMNMAEHLNTRISKYSKGMQKKLSLLVAFQNSPDAVILDEPFEGVDTIDRDRLMSYLKGFVEGGKTVILSTHILHDLDSLCQHAIFLKKGLTMLEYNPGTGGDFKPGTELSEEIRVLIESSGSGKSDPEATKPVPTITDIYRAMYQ